MDSRESLRVVETRLVIHAAERCEAVAGHQPPARPPRSRLLLLLRQDLVMQLRSCACAKREDERRALLHPVEMPGGFVVGLGVAHAFYGWAKARFTRRRPTWFKLVLCIIGT